MKAIPFIIILIVNLCVLPLVFAQPSTFPNTPDFVVTSPKELQIRLNALSTQGGNSNTQFIEFAPSSSSVVDLPGTLVATGLNATVVFSRSPTTLTCRDRVMMGGFFEQLTNFEWIGISFAECHKGGLLIHNSSHVIVSDASFTRIGDVSLDAINLPSESSTNPSIWPNDESILRTNINVAAALTMTGSTDVELYDLVFDRCETRQSTAGAMLTNIENLLMERVTFSNNYAALGAGGLHMSGVHTAQINDCTFDANQATVGAGAHIIYSSQIEVRRVSATANHAYSSGGAFSVDGSVVYFYEGTISNNAVAHGPGGGVHIISSIVELRDITMVDNLSEQLPSSDQLADPRLTDSQFQQIFGSAITVISPSFTKHSQWKPIDNRFECINGTVYFEGAPLGDNKCFVDQIDSASSLPGDIDLDGKADLPDRSLLVLRSSTISLRANRAPNSNSQGLIFATDDSHLIVTETVLEITGNRQNQPARSQTVLTLNDGVTVDFRDRRNAIEGFVLCDGSYNAQNAKFGQGVCGVGVPCECGVNAVGVSNAPQPFVCPGTSCGDGVCVSASSACNQWFRSGCPVIFPTLCCDGLCYTSQEACNQAKCSSGGGGTVPPTNTNNGNGGPVNATDTEGNVVIVVDGDFPPNSTVTISSGDAPSQDEEIVSPIIKVLVNGTGGDFDAEITLGSTLDDDDDLEDYCLARYDEEQEKWRCVDECLQDERTENGTRYVSGNTNHFSNFALLLGGDGCNADTDYWIWSLVALGAAVLISGTFVLLVTFVPAIRAWFGGAEDARIRKVRKHVKNRPASTSNQQRSPSKENLSGWVTDEDEDDMASSSSSIQDQV